MHRYFTGLFILFVIPIISVGQEYYGNSPGSYQLLLQIEKDSSVNFTYYDHQKIYAEYRGSIKRTKDLNYHISASLLLGNDLILSGYTLSKSPPYTLNDTDYFAIDTPFVKLADTVFISYSNDQRASYLPYNEKGEHRSFVLNKQNFNSQNPAAYYTVILKRQNKITGKALKFKMTGNSAFAVRSADQIDFDIIIKNNDLFTLDGHKLQTGNFKLKKKSSH